MTKISSHFTTKHELGVIQWKVCKLLKETILTRFKNKDTIKNIQLFTSTNNNICIFLTLSYPTLWKSLSTIKYEFIHSCILRITSFLFFVILWLTYDEIFFKTSIVYKCSKTCNMFSSSSDSLRMEGHTFHEGRFFLLLTVSSLPWSLSTSISSSDSDSSLLMSCISSSCRLTLLLYLEENSYFSYLYWLMGSRSRIISDWLLNLWILKPSLAWFYR